MNNLRYNIGSVLDSLEKDINRICVPSGVGCVADILRDSNL